MMKTCLPSACIQSQRHEIHTLPTTKNRLEGSIVLNPSVIILANYLDLAYPVLHFSSCPKIDIGCWEFPSCLKSPTNSLLGKPIAERGNDHVTLTLFSILLSLHFAANVKLLYGEFLTCL
jgi:hypothetical protein